jgi:GTP-binding protein Era
MYRCGYIAIVGRPNVGKSTLLNRILGQKISITSRKPQTTRHRILGINTTPSAQFIYIDTPGLHRGRGRLMNRIMNRAAAGALEEADVILFVSDCTGWTDEDDDVIELLKDRSAPVIMALNKLDKLGHRDLLLPQIAAAGGKYPFAEIVPISAATGLQVPELEQAIERHLPESPPLFPAEQITDRSERFLAAELIREKLMHYLGKEVPYSATVEIESFEEEAGLTRIGAIIWVEREAQKAIVIGKGGRMLKRIGREARLEMERMLGTKVFLQTWVKVRERWSDDERALRRFGYEE